MRGEPELLDEAHDEYEDAVAWYHERDPRVAAAFATEVKAAIARICEMPLTWPEDVAGTRRVLLKRFPYKVVYRVKGERIEIVAIGHQKRRPGYWLLR